VNEEVERFRRLAEQFCGLVESVDDLTRHDFLTRLNRALPELYGAVLDLPADRFVDGPDTPPFISSEASHDIFQRISAKLGDADDFRGVMDPYDSKEKLLESSLAHEIRDVYVELKSVLADDRAEDAAWDWRWAFDHEWGDHAVNVLKATHWLLHETGERWIDPDEGN
jgi:hypothetical protein